MPQISRWTFMFFIILSMMVIVIFAQAGISPQTLPWLTILVISYIVGSIFAFFGHILIPRLVRIYLGDVRIENDVIIVCGRDGQRPEDNCTAAMAFKLLPLQPVSDMQDEQVKALLTSVEGAVFGMPLGTLYCIHKTEDPLIPAELKRLQAEIKGAQLQANAPRRTIFSAAQAVKLESLQREMARLMRSRAVAAIQFIMIQARGRTDVEAVSRVKTMAQQVESIAQQIGCTAIKLSGINLRNLLEIMLMDRAVRWVET
ncbi:MAG: hypothetical protein QXE01_09270 [Sulfolobales archaeon]